MASDLATVHFNAPGEWRPFAVKQLVAASSTGTGPSSYWQSIPESLSAPELEHYFLKPDPQKTRAEDYGLLEFAVTRNGRLLMLTTARSVEANAQLQSAGWRITSREVRSEYGYSAAGSNTNALDWVLFERDARAGEFFSIRTETYQSPIILRIAEPPPKLQITKSGDDIVLSWPITGQDFRAEITAVLGFTPWELTDAPVVVGQNLTVRIPIANKFSQYYQLRRK